MKVDCDFTIAFLRDRPKFPAYGKSDSVIQARILPRLFMPKGLIDLETKIIQSVIGPIGQPGILDRSIEIVIIGGV